LKGVNFGNVHERVTGPTAAHADKAFPLDCLAQTVPSFDSMQKGLDAYCANKKLFETFISVKGGRYWIRLLGRKKEFSDKATRTGGARWMVFSRSYLGSC
jgi:hypothetical protein